MHKIVKTKGRKDTFDNEVRVETSLPPAVEGQLRCFLAVQVDWIIWKVKNHPKDIQVCLQWWGESGDGTMFWPISRKFATADKSLLLKKDSVTVLFPVCSGPKQFAAYLHDMSVLVLDVLHSKTLKPFGKVEIHEITQLSGSYPINRCYPVTSLSVQPVEFADIHVILKFEPVDVVGKHVSSFVPVIDQTFEQNLSNSVLNDIERGSLNNKAETDLNHDDKILKKETVNLDDDNVQTREGINQDDIISALIKRGKSLKDSIVESRASIDLSELPSKGEIDFDEEEPHQRSVPGSLFKEILKFDECDDTELIREDSSLPIELILEDNEEKFLYDYNSTSSVGSDSDDPVYDDSLLQDLFYVNKVQSDILVLSDDSRDAVDDKEKQKGIVEASITKENDKAGTVKKPSERPETGSANDLEKRSETPDTGSTKDPEVKVHQPIESVGTHVAGSYQDTKTMFPRNSQPGYAQDQKLLTRLGINKLTALGRVTAARVTIKKLIMTQEFKNDHSKSRTYFIEYEFPVAASTENNIKPNSSKDVGLEITRIATKKTTSEGIVFNHNSVFPVFFNSNVTSFWWNSELKVKVFRRKSEQKSPLLIGVGNLSLKNVLASQDLQFDGIIDIRSQKYHEGSSSESSDMAKIEVKIGLISNGKDLDFHESENFHESESEHAQDIDNYLGTNTGVKNLWKNPSHENKESKIIEQHQPKQIHINKEQTSISSDNQRAITLMTLLWISEGRNIVENGHGFRVLVPGTTTRSNFYLISRMFWTNDTSRSSICWGKNDPHFNFKQISPVLLTLALLDRMHNNFITLEVWNKSSGGQDDQLVGIAKLPLQQLYLSFKEEQTTKALMQSKFPVVAVDSWVNIKNPFKDSSQGDLRVLLAMGSETQIVRLQDIKQCSGDGNYGKLLTNPVNDRSQLQANFSRQEVYEKQVEHSFEITVQNVRKLFAFEKTLWGETDCFVQYNFPYQSPDAEPHNGDVSEDVPGLQNHRTPTTLCIPDTTFNDVSRYCVILPQTMPIQRFLLAAFHGSWTRTSISTAASGITFELWKRHYYPNIRDQLVAKGVLPLTKLCGIITMQRPGQASVQSISLPLTMLPSSEEKYNDHGGILEITIKYRQSKLSTANPRVGVRGKNVEEKPHVCLSIEIVRACGLKCAISNQAEKDSSLKYASEVGGNPFVKVKLPFNVKIKERTTRTIARTFTPEFSYRMDFILPLHVKEHGIGNDQESSATLAECLELGEVLFEIWHQRHRETCEDFDVKEVHGRHLRRFTPTSDVLLGVVKIPLQQLLFNHTGIKGWFPVTENKLGWSSEDHSSNALNSTVGGLELTMSFTEAKERERVIDDGRGMGWCLLPWYEDGQWLNETKENGLIDVGQGLSLSVDIKKVWVPKAITQAVQSLQGLKEKKLIGCYIRYKFYDTKPVFSAIRGVRKIKETNVVLCDLKHRHSYLVKTTSPFIWYVREEKLEIQVWLTSRNHEEKSILPHKRDKLVGSAFVNLFPLLGGNKTMQSEVSGLYPLFRSSAVDLSGAGLRVQLILRRPSNANQKFSEHDVDEDLVSTEHNSSIIHDKISISMESSDEEDAKTHQNQCEVKTEESLSSYEEDEYVIAAHVIIEQALHLPLIETAANKSIQPNVYVTYQQKSDQKPVKTKIIRSSTSPLWNHEKLIKFKSSEITKKVLNFKIWHSNNSGMAEQSNADQGEDLRVGSASVDLSPLASGLRQVMGWYNVVDLAGQCKGQIKVGVIPLSPISSRKTTPQGKGYAGFTEKPAGYLSDHVIQNVLNNQVNFPVEKKAINIEEQNSSKSFLLRQLRQNMKELDIVKERLSQRLMNTDDGFHTEISSRGDLEIKLAKKIDHKTKTSEVLQYDLMKAEQATCSSGDPPSSPMKDIQINICKPSLMSFLEERNVERNNYLDDDLKDDNDHPALHSDDCIKNDDYKKDDVSNDDQLSENMFIGAKDNVDGGHFIGGVSNGYNYNPSIDDNTGDDDCDQPGDDHKVNGDLDNNDNNEHVKRDQALYDNYGKLDVVEPSPDESLDSFFDIFKRNPEMAEDVEPHSDGEVDPQSVISRKNLGKLKNVLNEVNMDVEIKVDEASSHDVDDESDGGTLQSSSVIVERHSVRESEKYSLSQHQNTADSGEVIETTNINVTEEKHPCINQTDQQQQQNNFNVSLLNKPSFPNFFMPHKDLEQSMRSLRLAATFRKEPRMNIDMQQRSKTLEDVKDNTMLFGKEKVIAKSFANWKQVEEMRTTGKVPLTSKETSRLAKIFASTYSVDEEK